MRQLELHFVVVNDPEHGFDLMQEAQLGDWTVADIRKVDERWLITFFPPAQGGQCEITWETFLEISRQFTSFIHEMEHTLSTNVENMDL